MTEQEEQFMSLLTLIKPKANDFGCNLFNLEFLYFAIEVLLFLRLFINDLSHQIEVKVGGSYTALKR